MNNGSGWHMKQPLPLLKEDRLVRHQYIIDALFPRAAFSFVLTHSFSESYRILILRLETNIIQRNAPS